MGILPEELEQIPPDYTSAIRYRSGLFDAQIMESLDWLNLPGLSKLHPVSLSQNERGEHVIGYDGRQNFLCRGIDTSFDYAGLLGGFGAPGKLARAIDKLKR